MKTYPIFLASSFELQPEREKFEIFIGRQNKRLVKKNVLLQLDIWEDMGAELNKSRKQDDYNQVLHEAEIVLVLFWTKMGKYTGEEFDLAYRRFLDSETGRPLLYVYEKTVAPPREPEHWEKESKREFKNRLLTEKSEQFHSTFDHYAVLETHFLQTLHDLFDKNHLTFGKLAERHSLKAPFPPSLVIGREKELERISENFKNKGQVFLINAEGGMGKTTLASKYWQENRYTYKHCAYLFCEGGIIKAMTDDGMGLDLQGLDDAEKIRQLQRKLSSLADDFLLFLDNANEAKDIGEFLKVFQGYNWNVLITSRSREVLSNKAGEINLTHLDPDDAKALFLNFYREESEEFETLLDRLLKGINYHTLVIEVFSKTLKKASARGIDLKIFLEKFEEGGIILDRISNTKLETDYIFHVNKEVATPNDILEVLYDFTKLNEDERYYLVNMSLLPAENYQLRFLKDLFEPEDEVLFYETMDSLFQSGWIGGEIDAYRLSPIIQSLVQSKNRETLWEEGQLIFLKLKELLKYEQEKDNAHTKFKWLPFGRFLAALFRENDKEDFNVFLNDLALILWSIGGKSNLLEAKTHLEKALASNIRNFGEDASAVAISRSNLAMVFGDLGGERNLLEAKTHLEKALASDIASFGEDAPAVARCRSNLATVLKDLGGERNLLEAKTHLEKALASNIRNFGEDASAVAISRSNLAMVFGDLGGERNLLEAKTYLEKTLASDIASFGEDAPAVAIRRSNLATVLQGLGGESNLLEAKTHLEKALASGVASFGEDAPAVAIRRSKNHLEKALASDIRNFGTTHPDTILKKFNLGVNLVGLGQSENLKKALSLFDEALTGYRMNFGDDYYLVPRIFEWIEYLKKKLEEIGEE
jgi:hypothetical protein